MFFFKKFSADVFVRVKIFHVLNLHGNYKHANVHGNMSLDKLDALEWLF